MGPVARVSAARRLAAALYAAGWEARRRCYAAGLMRSTRVGARVVSVGNLTVGGTGKTTLTLHLARAALEAGRNVAVVCRNYHPGPRGIGDEPLLFRGALGPERVFFGRRKLSLAAAAVAAGHDLILVDDGFSHWRLDRDLDLVLLDAENPWGGGALLPAGRLREPRRALQRAAWLVLTRVSPGRLDRESARVSRYAPGARLAAGRHKVVGLRRLDGGPPQDRAPVRVVTATGNPDAVAASAREANLEVVALSKYRDHHWFGAEEARRELAAAERAGARVLLTAKDAVRWPLPPTATTVVLEVEWEWVEAGEALRAAVLGEGQN
jgi:tetraacyldisaccharide 4'-kinase